MERKALGKGISALIPEREVERKNEIINVQSELIRPNPFQPREDFDNTSIEELAQSIKEKGIIQPLLVRRQGDFYELIAGERRLRACKLLNIKEIPIIVREAEDRDSLELALIENVQRESLNPIEEAHAFQHLIDKFQVTQEKISAVLGKSRVTVTNTLRLLKLPKAAREALAEGLITEGHARALLGLSNPVGQTSALQTILKQDMTVRQTEELIRRLSGEKSVQTVFKALDPVINELEDRLSSRLGTKVSIHHGKKGGSVVIHYYSDEELNTIIGNLTEK